MTHPLDVPNIEDVFDLSSVNGHKKRSRWQKRIDEAKASADGDPVREDEELSKLLNERALEIINSHRPIREQKSALKRVAASLGFKPDTNFINGLYAQHDISAAAYEPDVLPGEAFVAPKQSWLLSEVFILGLNLLVGMPGAGKSRLLVALIRAYLNDQPTFIGRELRPGSMRKVLLVGTDQDRQQWGALLEEQGLATVVRSFKDEDGTDQVEFKNHPSIYLKTSGGCFSLDADGMRWIRNWCQQNPGGLLIIDSLSAVLPAGISEGDEAAGRLMRQIEVARQACTCIVTHHTKKSAASAGELGVYSGSGHGSIDRAVSRFIGLGYESHIQNGVEKFHEESSRRILTSQKRAGVNQRFVLENGDRNTWELIGTAAEVRDAQRADDEEETTAKFTGWRKDVWEVTTTDWKETSAIFDALPDTRKAKANGLRVTREQLRYLKGEWLLDQEPAGQGTEARWRRKLQVLP